MIKPEEYFNKIPYDFGIPNVKKWVCDQIEQTQMDISIEFADWINNHKEGFHSMYRDKRSIEIFWGSSYCGERSDYTSKELFELFLKDKNNG